MAAERLLREGSIINYYCLCNEYGTIYAISSNFGDHMTTQSMGLMVLLNEHF